MEYRRFFQPGGTFFFTVVTYKRLPWFREDRACVLFRSVLAEVKAERSFTVDAAVVLHDHLHMIWTLPTGDADFSGRWSKIKSLFSRRWRRAMGGPEAAFTRGMERDRRRGVWQPRFFEHTIRDEEDYIAHVEYIHYNPVRHGYVCCPKDWPRSSFHRFVRRGAYPVDWCCGDEPPASVERLNQDALE